jgi:hypothetical protein
MTSFNARRHGHRGAIFVAAADVFFLKKAMKEPVSKL